jgi:hypothetical protein
VGKIMEEHKNKEKHKWAEHGLIKYSDIINRLLEGSTNSRNLPEDEKKWITFALHQDHSIPFYKADKFVGGAQITPYNRIKQYLLEVQSRQQLVEHNEMQIELKELELERDEDFYSKLDPVSYEARFLKINIHEHYRALKQLKVNLRGVQKERNSYLRLIKEFNESPMGQYKDGRLLIDLLSDDDICEELEKEHWTYRMAKQTALDWIAYGRPGIGNMDAIFQMDKDQQEEVMRTAIELYTRNELRNKRIQDDIHNQISQGLPPGKLVKYLEIEINDDKQEKKLEDAYTIQARSRPTITKHSAENW